MNGNEAADVQTFGYGEGVQLDGPVPAKIRARPPMPVVPGLRPKQVLAAMMLVEGRMAKEVAMHLQLSPETVSRWRTQPAFLLLMRELLQDSIEATKLGLVSLFSESIVHLRGLICGLDDDKALKAINVLYSKAGPVLTAINTEVQRPVSGESGNSRRLRSYREVTPKVLAKADAAPAAGLAELVAVAPAGRRGVEPAARPRPGQSAWGLFGEASLPSEAAAVAGRCGVQRTD